MKQQTAKITSDHVKCSDQTGYFFGKSRAVIYKSHYRDETQQRTTTSEIRHSNYSGHLLCLSSRIACCVGCVIVCPSDSALISWTWALIVTRKRIRLRTIATGFALHCTQSICTGIVPLIDRWSRGSSAGSNVKYLISIDSVTNDIQTWTVLERDIT